MAAEPPRNSFRAAVIRGERPPVVVTDKAPRLDHSSEGLDAMVPRSESRRGNHRNTDRHRLNSETATARYDGEEHEVELVNLSAGGAMIRTGFSPRLWDMIELEIRDGPSLEGAVRWLRDDLVGLEFAHETRIDCGAEERAALLLEVIQRSFPDVEVQLDRADADTAPAEQSEEDLGKRRDKRHPLIWKGELHYDCDSCPVRIRNISSGGALVDVVTEYPLGAEVLLDLGNAGQFSATVTWVHGEQAGLKFDKPFDIGRLAQTRPEVTPHRWLKIDFGLETQESSPWDEQWTRSSLADIRSQLEGYLKR